jgi:hypothetical protein
MSWISPKDEAAAYHIPGRSYDVPVKYLGDMTTSTDNGITVPTNLVVDPIGNSAWIHEGNTWKHRETKDRGRALDHREVNALLSSVQSTAPHTPKPTLPSASELLNSNQRFLSRASAYLPTGRQERDPKCIDKEHIDAGHRSLWNSKSKNLLSWRGVDASGANYGMEPTIKRMIDRNQLPDKSRAQIEAEMNLAQQRVSNRINDRSGPVEFGLNVPPDHQRPHPATRPVISISDIAQPTTALNFS